MEDEVWPKWTLDINELELGDIIGTASNTRSSRLIRECTGNGPISHVALYVGNDTVVECVQPRGRHRIASLFITASDLRNVVVLRLRSRQYSHQISNHAMNRAMAEAAIRHQSLYSLAKALAFRFAPIGRLAATDALICSELVVRAYAAGGIDLVKHCATDLISPNTLYECKAFENVTHRCVRASIPDRHAFIETVGISYAEFKIRSPIVGTKIQDWLSAIAYAISIQRLILKVPFQFWRWWHFWPYYLMRRGGELQLRLKTRWDAMRLASSRELLMSISVLEIERNIRRSEDFINELQLRIAVAESLRSWHSIHERHASWVSRLARHYARVVSDLNLRIGIWRGFQILNREMLQRTHVTV